MLNNNVYEIGLLVNPDLSQQEALKVVGNIKTVLENQSASVISEGEVVDIDLAYQIITKIASKNQRFDKAFFCWVKFEAQAEALAMIKKEVDKVKSQVFRYLITKTIADDEATDKYQEISDVVEIETPKNHTQKVEGDAIDTTEENTEENKDSEEDSK